MIRFVDNNVNDAKTADIGRQQRFTDIHCHLLPGLDDGPQTVSESLALCQSLTEEGIGCVVATPHQLGRFDGCNDAAKVRDAVSSLSEALKNNGIALKVVPGAEVRVDERICKLLEADRILTLADGGRYILLELPYEVFIDVRPLLSELSCIGVQAVISHPERCAPVAALPHMVRRWLENGAHLVITASSLLGDFGPKAKKAAWYFLSSGWVSLVATDAHDTGRSCPKMKVAFDRISIKLGKDLACLVCIENPSRLVSGQDIVRLRPSSQPQAE